MTDQEARDEREALAVRLELEFGSFLAQWPANPDRFFGQAADALIAAGYRKHPAPEVTDETLLSAFEQFYLVDESDPFYDRKKLLAGLRAVAALNPEEEA